MSQNKKILIPIERLAALYVDECKIKIAYQIEYDENNIIGNYMNEQRAKEVLEIIYNRYDKGQRVFPMPEE